MTPFQPPPSGPAHPTTRKPIPTTTGTSSLPAQNIPTDLVQLSAPLSLTSCTQWAEGHIRSIFEATSNEEASNAVRETFSSRLEATFNGISLHHALSHSFGSSPEDGGEEGTPNQRPTQRDELERRVNVLRGMTSHEFGGRLKVEWGDFVEVPLTPGQSGEPMNRNAYVAGIYYIHGVMMRKPSSSPSPALFHEANPTSVEWIPATRKKVVFSKLVSESSDLSIDSRRIQEISVMVEDIPISMTR